MKAFSGAAALLALALLVHAAAATRLAPEGRQLLQVGGTCTTKIPAVSLSGDAASVRRRGAQLRAPVAGPPTRARAH